MTRAMGALGQNITAIVARDELMRKRTHPCPRCNRPHFSADQQREFALLSPRKQQAYCFSEHHGDSYERIASKVGIHTQSARTMVASTAWRLSQADWMSGMSRRTQNALRIAGIDSWAAFCSIMERQALRCDFYTFLHKEDGSVVRVRNLGRKGCAEAYRFYATRIAEKDKNT